MTPTTAVRGGACIAVASVVAFIAGGAGASARRDTASPLADRAIRVALAKLGHNWMFAPFPRRVGRVACRIPSGGIQMPAIPGNCQTRVASSRRYVSVAFVESWDAEAFDGEGGRADGALSHTWVVIESKSLRPLDVVTFGDFPPQWVR